MTVDSISCSVSMARSKHATTQGGRNKPQTFTLYKGWFRVHETVLEFAVTYQAQPGSAEAAENGAKRASVGVTVQRNAQSTMYRRSRTEKTRTTIASPT